MADTQTNRQPAATNWRQASSAPGSAGIEPQKASSKQARNRSSCAPDVYATEFAHDLGRRIKASSQGSQTSAASEFDDALQVKLVKTARIN
jgi:hypothetical protein